MVVQFCYAHRFSDIRESRIKSSFDIVIDPIRYLSNRFAAAQFLDGSFRTAPKAFAILLAPSPVEKLHVKNSPQFRGLGMIARIGTVVRRVVHKRDLPADTVALIATDSAAPVNRSGLEVIRFSNKKQMDIIQTLIDKGYLPKSCYDPDLGVFRSLTGQMEANVYDGTFKAVSEKTESVVVPKGKSFNGKLLSVKNATEFCTVGIVAPDGADLKAAKRILLIHLTDSSKVNRRFSDSTRKISIDPGVMPMLAGAGQAEITLNLPGTWEVYAVDTTGRRMSSINVTKTDEGIRFPVSVFNKFGQTFSYELIRK